MLVPDMFSNNRYNLEKLKPSETVIFKVFFLLEGRTHQEWSKESVWSYLFIFVGKLTEALFTMDWNSTCLMAWTNTCTCVCFLPSSMEVWEQQDLGSVGHLELSKTTMLLEWPSWFTQKPAVHFPRGTDRGNHTRQNGIKGPLRFFLWLRYPIELFLSKSTVTGLRSWGIDKVGVRRQVMPLASCQSASHWGSP